jgi:hypothetical protein
VPGALSIVLENAPYGPHAEDAKVRSTIPVQSPIDADFPRSQLSKPSLPF